MERTGKQEEFPESALVAAALPSGWFLIVAGEFGHPMIRDEAVRRLSRDGEVITCALEEHVMVSESAWWRGGLCVWRVIHDAQTSMDHLSTDGELPAAFAAIRDRAAAEQEAAGGVDTDVDFYFEIPVELAKSVTGYWHDADAEGLGTDAFEVLRSAKKGFFQRLFGK